MSRVDVISIGTLDRNRLWQESQPVRTAHATTSLIRVGKRMILVDPGLPVSALVARLSERTGLEPRAIDTVFLTNFTVAHRGGLDAFPHARLLMWEPEIENARAQARELLDRNDDETGDDELRRAAEEALELLDRAEPAEDQIESGKQGGVDLFPLPGHTPGSAGLLVTSAALTTLIAGDAVPTLDHFLAGQVLPDATDIRQAQESLREAYEIADVIVPGHDNIFTNPRTQGLG